LQTTFLSPKVLEEFFFFSFTRNPFDRIVSSYFEATSPLLRKAKEQSHRQLASYNDGRAVPASDKSVEVSFEAHHGEQSNDEDQEKNKKLRRKVSQQPGLDVILLGAGSRWSSNVHFRSQVHQLAAATSDGRVWEGSIVSNFLLFLLSLIQLSHCVLFLIHCSFI